MGGGVEGGEQEGEIICAPETILISIVVSNNISAYFESLKRMFVLKQSKNVV